VQNSDFGVDRVGRRATAPPISMLSISLLLALALPIQDAQGSEPPPLERAPDETAQAESALAEPLPDDAFVIPELQESAVPS